MKQVRAAYTADRAAALAGVPKSTVHYWARTELLVPSVSAERVKLWSYSDVVALRIIGWLRESKRAPGGHEIPATHLSAIRRALKQLKALELDLYSEERGATVLVDRKGKVHIDSGGVVSEVAPPGSGAQVVEAEVLDLMAPFQYVEGQSGPDLRHPRPSLRIIPGKLAGSPHIADTRIETVALAALHARGMKPDLIAQLYPALSDAAIRDALDLERQLASNLAAA